MRSSDGQTSVSSEEVKETIEAFKSSLFREPTSAVSEQKISEKERVESDVKRATKSVEMEEIHEDLDEMEEEYEEEFVDDEGAAVGEELLEQRLSHLKDSIPSTREPVEEISMKNTEQKETEVTEAPPVSEVSAI